MATNAPTRQLSPSRHRFTVTEYQRIAEAGVLAEHDRVELIEGEIIDMTPIGPGHGAGVDRALDELKEALGRRVIIRVQGSIVLNDQTQPQPDVALLRRRADFYVQQHPGPQDIFLLIEVSDTSLAYDIDAKAKMYAEAGIPEYWVFDVASKAIFLFDEPGLDGYQRRRVARGNDRVGLKAFPDVTFTASQLIGE